MSLNLGQVLQIRVWYRIQLASVLNASLSAHGFTLFERDPLLALLNLGDTACRPFRGSTNFAFCLAIAVRTTSLSAY